MNLAVEENRSFQPKTRPIRAGSASFFFSPLWVEVEQAQAEGGVKSEIPPGHAKAGLFPDICPREFCAREENARQSLGTRRQTQSLESRSHRESGWRGWAGNRHGMSKGGWPESQRGNTGLLDQQQDNTGTTPTYPPAKSFGATASLPARTRWVADALLDAVYVSSPNETQGQNHLIGFICRVHYSLNK